MQTTVGKMEGKINEKGYEKFCQKSFAHAQADQQQKGEIQTKDDQIATWK